jgi:hypothetical protein
MILSGAYSYNLYYTPSAYVDMDVNPSLELVLNRFDRVIDTRAYNNDGEAVLKRANIKHKKFDDAIDFLLDTMIAQGYAQEESLISLTLQANDNERESRMLSVIESTVHEHHGSAHINAFSVDENVRNAAHHLDLSPAKYLAIQELIEVDPTVTYDSCRGQSIGEINRRREEHSEKHRGNHGDGRGHGHKGGHHN